METINIGARFAPASASVPAARRFVLTQAQVAELPAEVRDEVALLVSELATNAVIHARTPFRVEVSIAVDLVRVEVEDEHPALPRPRAAAQEATTGRGLLILDRVADRWGTTSVDGGKRVWFERVFRPADAPHQVLPA